MPNASVAALVCALGLAAAAGSAGEPSRARGGSAKADGLFTDSFVEGRVALRPVEPRLIFEYLPGIYDRPRPQTSAERLWVFPNGEYSISRWCDICGDEAVEIGRWEIRGDSIQLTPSLPSARRAKASRRLEEALGGLSSLRLFIRENRSGDIDSYLVSDAMASRPAGEVVPSLVRRREFYDWQGWLSRHREQLESPTLDP